jgi:hypothetical protein
MPPWPALSSVEGLALSSAVRPSEDDCDIFLFLIPIPLKTALSVSSLGATALVYRIRVKNAQ